MKTKFLKLCTAIALIMSLGSISLKAQPLKPSKPFLIQGKLPHLVSTVKILWDDDDLALSDEQKEKLTIVKKNTKKQVKNLAKEINKLQSYIVKATLDGMQPKNLKDDMYKLAKLRADASMVHLECIYNTREILSPEQLKIIE
ncbi:MAG: hypothetical protein L3I99_06645 [Sulfurimonas sp.]|nr:hypothetical protein [Sulfurimonas sp.]